MYHLGLSILHRFIGDCKRLVVEYRISISCFDGFDRLLKHGGKIVRRLIMTWCLLTTPLAMAETWVCRHDSPDREELTFMPQSDGTVAWQHQKLGALDPLAVVVNTDSLLTMATQRLNILYSRFFHLDKFSGRMGETTFRAATLRRLAEKDPELNWGMVTTVWQCESKTPESK